MRANLNDKNESPEVQKLRDEGKAGKLWQAQILCSHRQITRLFQKNNMTEDQLAKFIENVWRKGVMLPEDPGHWLVIHPLNILAFDVYRQKFFIEP